MRREFPPPETVVIEISRNCNLNCIMCGFGGHPIRHEFFMPQALFTHILQEVASQATELRLNGRGESALHPAFMEMIEETDILNHIRLSLFTNFSWKKDPLLNCFQEKRVVLFLSIDSPIRIEFEAIRRSSSFYLFLQNLEQIKQMDPRPTLVFTLQVANLHRIVDIAQFALDYEVNLIYNVVRADDPHYRTQFWGYLTKNWTTIQTELVTVKKCLEAHGLQVKIPDQIWGKKIEFATHKTSGTVAVCPNVRTEVFIGYDGTIYPCNMFHPFIYGYLEKEVFETIWASERHQWFLVNQKHHPYCANCEFICDHDLR